MGQHWQLPLMLDSTHILNMTAMQLLTHQLVKEHHHRLSPEGLLNQVGSNGTNDVCRVPKSIHNTYPIMALNVDKVYFSEYTK